MKAAIITQRRSDVEAEILRLKERLSELSNELRELEIAERVFDRLSGGDDRPTNSENEQLPVSTQVTRRNLPSVRQMIKNVMMEEDALGLGAMSPQEVRQRILDTYGVSIGAQISTNLSRMLNEFKELERDEETGRYSLLDVKSSSSKEPETDPLDDI